MSVTTDVRHPPPCRLFATPHARFHAGSDHSTAVTRSRPAASSASTRDSLSLSAYTRSFGSVPDGRTSTHDPSASSGYGRAYRSCHAATWGEEYDQPVRFGPLGEWSDFLGRMPEAVVLDCRDVPRVAWTNRGRSTFDRPDVDDLLAAVDEALERSPDATASP